MNYLTNIKQICAEKGISIQKLENMCGIANGTIGRWNNSVPSSDCIYKVSQGLEVPIEWIFTGKPQDADANQVNKTPEPILNQDEQLLFKCFNETDYMGKARIIQCCLNEYDRVNK